MTPRYGAPAPDFSLPSSQGGEVTLFSLPSSQGGEVTLASFRGQADIVLAFYCYDWGGI